MESPVVEMERTLNQMPLLENLKGNSASMLSINKNLDELCLQSTCREAIDDGKEKQNQDQGLKRWVALFAENQMK